MEVKKENKKKGYITVVAVLVFSFISWAIFSASFLISEELFVLRDRKEIEKNESIENLLEAVFLKKVEEIEKEISENPDTKDVIRYFMKKGNTLLWLNNYDAFTKSDNGFVIDKIFIKNSDGDEKTYDYSDKETVFKFKNLIKNNSVPKRTNKAVISFSKELKNVYTEEMEDKKYTIKIMGQVHTEYIFEKYLDEDSLVNCEIKELRFEIY